MWEQLIVEDAHGRITGRIGHRHQQLKTTDFNNMADETANLELQQQFAPVVTNRSKSRSGIDNRHTIAKHKSRKQDHLNTQVVKHVRSVSDIHPKTNHLAKYRSSIGLTQQRPNYTFLDFLNSADPLSIGSLSSAHSQCSNPSSLESSVDSRPGSCGDSQQSGSSDESTANQNSPRRRLNSSSPDSFGRFRIFEKYSASAAKMSPADQNHERRVVDYEIHEDLNMNFIKISVTDVDDNSARQSHDLGIRESPNSTDVSNDMSSGRTEETDNVERQSFAVCEQTNCISSSRWDLASVPSVTANESGVEEPPDTLQPIHPGKAHFCPRLLYCQTCSKYVCENCAALCVYRHVTVEQTEYLDTVQQQVEDMLNEGYLGIDVLTDDIKDVMDELRFLHVKAKDQKTAGFYEEHFYPHILYERYKNLKDDQGRLKDALRDLERIIHIAHPHPNKLLKLKDRVLAEIWRIRQNRKTKLRSGRENGILFKNYRWLQSYFPYEMTDNIRLKYPIPRGRSVMGYDHNINLCNRIDNQVHSTDIQIIGHFGEGHSQNLCRPWGVTVDAEGNIIVSDRSNNRIQIFRRNGVLVRSFGTYGNGQCEFNKPAGIAVDARRRLVVADKDNHRIQILTMEGVFLREFGEYGDKEGHFNYPWDVAVNSTCEIAVTDTRNHRVQLFSAEGVFLRVFGGQPQNLRYLDSPRGVCFNKEGNLLVTDFNYHHVLKIDYDMEQARVLRCDNELRVLRGDGSKEMSAQNAEGAPFQRPQGIISADDGNFLVADSRHNSIKAFNSLGHLMYVYNPGAEEINRPLGLALHTDGRLVFTDNGQNYVRLVKLTNHVSPIRRNTIMFG